MSIPSLVTFFFPFVMRTFRIYSLCACNCHAQSLSCVQLFCDPMDCSLPGSSVYGIPQARLLAWVAISPTRGSSWFRDQTHVSSISCIAGRFFTAGPTGKPYPTFTDFSKKAYHFGYTLNSLSSDLPDELYSIIGSPNKRSCLMNGTKIF